MSPRAGEAPPLPHPLPRVSAAVRLRRRSLGAGGWRKTGRQRRTRREGPTQARPGLRTATAQPFVKHEFLAPAQGVSHFWEIAEIKGGRLPSRNAADRAQTIHRKRSCFLKSRSHFPRKSEARDVNETYLMKPNCRRAPPLNGLPRTAAGSTICARRWTGPFRRPERWRSG
jgi:hypothetical protein